MIWFSVHVVLGIIPESYAGGKIEVYENVYLVSAENEDDAIECGRKLGVAEETDNVDLEVSGVRAMHPFLGVRKVVRVSNLNPPQDTAPPSFGTELTYSLLQLENLDEARRFASGSSVIVRAME